MAWDCKKYFSFLQWCSAIQTIKSNKTLRWQPQGHFLFVFSDNGNSFGTFYYKGIIRYDDQDSQRVCSLQEANKKTNSTALAMHYMKMFCLPIVAQECNAVIRGRQGFQNKLHFSFWRKEKHPGGSLIVVLCTEYSSSVCVMQIVQNR